MPGLNEIYLHQHHEVIRFEDVDRILAAGGAMEAFVAARKAGKIRFIGFTRYGSNASSTRCGGQRKPKGKEANILFRGKMLASAAIHGKLLRVR